MIYKGLRKGPFIFTGMVHIFTECSQNASASFPVNTFGITGK
jgi:hypothetical protein